MIGPCEYQQLMSTYKTICDLSFDDFEPSILEETYYTLNFYESTCQM